MCPTGNRAQKRPSGFMTTDTFTRIIEECDGRVGGVRFIGWGEPTLLPDLHSFIQLATEFGLLTHVNTNASKLTDDMAEKLVDAGLSSIKFSFQGVDRESYGKMRKTDFFHGMLLAIKRMNFARGNRKYPFIAASTTVTDEPQHLIDSFREEIEQIVDHLSIGKTIFGFMDLKAARLTPKEREMIESLLEVEKDTLQHPDPCPEVFDKLTIQWDGSVRVCCNDYNGTTNLGNINTSSLEEIWTHPTIEGYRDRLSRGEYTGPLCENCWAYIK